MIQRLCLTFAVTLGMAVYLLTWTPPVPQPQQDTRWQKLDAQGRPMMIWAGPWQCVADRSTGLTWEAKTDDESIHDGYWTYSWFDGNTGTPQQGDCFFAAQRCHTQLLIDRANHARLCGFEDWRLPTLPELRSLVDLQAEPGAPTLDNAFFLHTRLGDYWTADAEQPLSGFYRHLGKGAWAINFKTGQASVLPYRNAAYVRLVRTARPSSPASDRPLQKLNNSSPSEVVPSTQNRR